MGARSVHFRCIVARRIFSRLSRLSAALSRCLRFVLSCRIDAQFLWEIHHGGTHSTQGRRRRARLFGPGLRRRAVTLEALLGCGRGLVLYFYPKDNTAGCTLEAQGFRDHLADFEALASPLRRLARQREEPLRLSRPSEPQFPAPRGQGRSRLHGLRRHEGEDDVRQALPRHRTLDLRDFARRPNPAWRSTASRRRPMWRSSSRF